MEKDLVKDGYQAAQDSLKENKEKERERQVEEVKRIVLKTLEKIETLKGEKEKASGRVKEIEEQIKILRMDIDDLKEGRLDRIEERQGKDPQAKSTSVVLFEKQKHPIDSIWDWWLWPWSLLDNTSTASPIKNWDIYVTSSSAKWATPGTYRLSDGTIVNLR